MARKPLKKTKPRKRRNVLEQKAIRPTRSMKGIPKRRPIEDRFWEKVRIAGADDCWIWLGAVRSTPTPYGTMRDVTKRMRPAHQLAWEISNGKSFPQNMKCCHTCDNTLCCNPRHLFVGTHTDNMQDMISKGRKVTLKGERAPNSKLTNADIADIKSKYSKGDMLQKQLAKEYEVCPSTICGILKGRLWRQE